MSFGGIWFLVVIFATNWMRQSSIAPSCHRQCREASFERLKGVKFLSPEWPRFYFLLGRLVWIRGSTASKIFWYLSLRLWTQLTAFIFPVVFAIYVSASTVKWDIGWSRTESYSDESIPRTLTFVSPPWIGMAWWRMTTDQLRRWAQNKQLYCRTLT